MTCAERFPFFLNEAGDSRLHLRKDVIMASVSINQSSRKNQPFFARRLLFSADKRVLGHRLEKYDKFLTDDLCRNM